jgi:short-subunit dehydrogenase
LRDKRKLVIVGATSSIAEHCTRILVQGQSRDITLIGRDISRLGRVAADLGVRSPQSDIRMIEGDFHDPAAIQATVNDIAAHGAVDMVLIAHGSLPEQSDCQTSLQACFEALEINGISPVLYAEAFARHMDEANLGTIALLGSVAGDRGRKSNYVYGSAKDLLSRYAQGLQHRFAGTGVKVVLIKLGPTDTPMTAHLKEQGVKLASVEDVALQIVKAIKGGKAVAYVPGKWKIIMMVIRHLPAFIFNKLDI